MFTFLTITYNHEKFIIEHLESIKYQIENYGKDNEFKYILSDDCSKDTTVSLVKEWIRMNSHLFKEVKILINKNNKGIVANYLVGTGAINTYKYKLLAGDDLFYRNNIFEAIQKYDLVFTPLIRFSETQFERDGRINYLLVHKTIKNIRRLHTLNNYSYAPSLFMSRELIQNPGLRQFISKYKWIEDIPQIYYLLNHITDINININKIPYILYRTSHGVSKNLEDNKYSTIKDEFTEEAKCIAKDLDLKLIKYPKYINPYRYYSKYLHLKLKYYDNFYNEEVVEANNIMENELKQAPEYLNHIKAKAYEFYKSIGKEELYGQPIIINKN